MSLQKLFDSNWYLAQNPDVAEAVTLGLTNAWPHFEQYGMHEGRSPLSWFDEAFYLSRNPDVTAAVDAGLVNAVEHFVLYGQQEVRAVAPFIDLASYLSANPDVASAVEAGLTSPLFHLVEYGFLESRDLGNGISLALFADDPVFKAAAEAGNVAGALGRVDAVAPFLPGFIAPEGWVPAADTPIPVDFVPPAGLDVKLVVPAGVIIPEGVELPSTFQPVTSGGGSGSSGGVSSGGGSSSQPETATFKPKVDFNEGASDASTALVLDEQFMVVADDEGSVLRVYDRSGGEAVLEWSIKNAAPSGSNLGNDEIDIEAGTRIGDTLYFTGSHSNKKSGSDAPEREFLFAVTVSGTGADTEFQMRDVQSGLATALAAWDTGNVHGKGGGYYGLASSAANGIVPEQVSGFSIEGMTASLDNNDLLLGFRAPQVNTTARENALIVPVSVASVFDTPVFGSPIELNLGGRGIRSIEKANDESGYLIIAGPAGSASGEVTHDFRLYRWDGTSEGGQATGLQALDVVDANGAQLTLDGLLAATGGSFETLVDVASVNAGTRIQLLQDNGDTVWEGKSDVSKDLPTAEQQFIGNWVTIGGVAADVAPTLAASNIGSGAVIGRKADLVLKFDESVKRGTGDIVLKSGGTVIQTFSVAESNAITFDYNIVTINPTADLIAGQSYVLEFAASAIVDSSNQAWASAASMPFSAAPPASYNLLITEVTSKHTSDIDFFELYNYGTDAIDLSGWRWTDSSGATYGSFASETSIAGGEVLVVVGEAGKLDGFLLAWGLTSNPARFIEVGGPGLGKNDAVIVYDAADNAAAWFNYSANAITALDGAIIEKIPGGGDKHAGVAAGASSEAVSAIWDGASTTDPVYVAATTLTGAPQGTPGSISVGI
ncbi:lamin tail domain-containing protein [Alcaligenaceae bacterium]|nr:lamin tail domain-containing protein [Alcaligenaceae bacterium]